MWLFLLFLILVLILFSGKLQKKIAVNRWRKAFNLDKHAQVLQKLYAGIDGFALSREARATQDSMEYVYGEIIFEPFIALLSLCKPDSSTVFYDLGSGTGKAVLASVMVFPIHKSYGIELFSSLHQTGLLQQQSLKSIPEYKEKADCIEFKNENFLNTNLKDATIIFINSTTFFGKTWNTLSKHLEQINPGCMVISTSKPLHSKGFVTLHKTKVAMSWGVVSAFIQKRTDEGDCIDA